MPYVYWRNLVLGDPMAAPYAMRPRSRSPAPATAMRLTGAVSIHVDATDPGDRGVASIVLYADGVEVARADGDTLDYCLALDAGDGHQLLAVARAADDPTGARPWQPKGWLALSLDSDGGSTECAPPMPDAGTSGQDAGVSASDASVNVDGGTSPPAAGCGCRVGRGRESPAWLALALLGLTLLRRRP